MEYKYLFTCLACILTALLSSKTLIQEFKGLRIFAATPRLHTYTTEILSKDPLMIYVNKFLLPEEIRHLLHLSENLFVPSRVYTAGEEAPPSYRTSKSCVLPSKDPIVAGIEARALAFTGFLPHAGVEAIQLVHYQPTDMFALHHDWFQSPLVDEQGQRYNRIASFFIYLETNFTAGQTFFPNLPPPPASKEDDDRFSSTAANEGLGILPTLGSGVFWVNLHDNGTGDSRTLHAGLPVRDGSKTGMNIWIKTIAQ